MICPACKYDSEEKSDKVDSLGFVSLSGQTFFIERSYEPDEKARLYGCPKCNCVIFDKCW